MDEDLSSLVIILSLTVRKGQTSFMLTKKSQIKTSFTKAYSSPAPELILWQKSAREEKYFSSEKSDSINTLHRFGSFSIKHMPLAHLIFPVRRERI